MVAHIHGLTAFRFLIISDDIFKFVLLYSTVLFILLQTTRLILITAKLLLWNGAACVGNSRKMAITYLLKRQGRKADIYLVAFVKR